LQPLQVCPLCTTFVVIHKLFLDLLTFGEGQVRVKKSKPCG
jgi:hypothetical protein